MLIKKRSILTEKSGVHYMNGIATIGPVKLNVCSFAVDGVLIDTGAASLATEFKSFFADADIDKVLLTHDHEDHTGGAAFLQKKYGVPIYINDMSVRACPNKASYPLYRQLFWGRRRPFEAQAIGQTFSSRTATWKVLDTPGHSADHLAFLNEQTGQLFSGDLFVHPETKVVLREESIPQIIASIEYVLTQDFGELFCCHAGYVADGRQAFNRKLQYLTELQGEIVTLYEKGLTVKEIQAQLFPKKYPIIYFSRGEWDTIHIVRSVIEDKKRATV